MKKRTKSSPNKAGPAATKPPHKRGRPKSSTKTPVSIRLDDDVLAFFKAKGADTAWRFRPSVLEGWQTRISDFLRAIVDVAR